MKNFYKMKILKRISIALLLLANQYTQAFNKPPYKKLLCDVCSCGATNSTSVMTNTTVNYIGVNYSYLDFKFKESVFSGYSGGDFINTLQITGQYFITDHISANISIPLQKNVRETPSELINNDGLGDIAVFGYYNFLTQEPKHNLKLGLGVKLPTGNFNEVDSNLNANSNAAIQFGTGSYDFIFPITYGFQYERFKFSTTTMYFLKGENEEKFKYGNQTQISADVSYKWIEKESFLFSSILGISNDNFKPTERAGIVDYRTDGELTNAKLGIEFELDSWILGGSYQHPIAQDIIDEDVKFEAGFGFYSLYKF